MRAARRENDNNWRIHKHGNQRWTKKRVHKGYKAGAQHHASKHAHGSLAAREPSAQSAEDLAAVRHGYARMLPA